MKKLIASLLVVLMLAAMTVPALASGFTVPSSVSTKAAGEESSADEAETEEEAGEPGGSGGVTEAVLYDENGFKITVKGLSEGYSGPEFNLLLENHSGKNVIIEADSVSVNGYMASAYLYTTVSDGKKVNDTLSIDQDQLDLCGISDIAEVEVVFEVIEDETYDEILLTDPLTITTDKAEGFEYTFDDSGALAYEGEGLRVVVKGLKEDEYGYETCLYLYIENNLDKDIILEANDSSVNGFMLNGYIWAQVNAGKRAVEPIEFNNDDLEENGISTIEDIEFSLRVIEDETWDEIVETDPISLSF